MAGVLRESWRDLRHTETQRRGMCEDGGQRLRGCIYKQGIHRTGGNQQKLGERHGADLPSEPPGGTHTADTLILDFTSSAVRGYISTV